MSANIKVDSQFERQLVPLSAHELAHLEQAILNEGCRDPLVVWDQEDGTHVLLDGHNRYRICTENGIDFDIETRQFETRDDAEDWIDRNQLSRRNITPEEFKIVSGRIYNRRKKTHAEAGALSSYPQIEDSSKTSETVAEELGVSKATIERNGDRAEVYDTLVDAGEPEAADIAKSIPQADVAQAKRELKTQPVKDVADRIKAKPHVSKNTGCPEWYTPSEFIEAARKVMGKIDLDPASSEVAQETVKAETFFTASDDGLTKSWSGCVWLNPPYANGVVSKFTEKLAESNVEQAVLLVNNATETSWFQDVAQHAAAIALPRGRIKFNDATGTPQNAPLQGQAFLYIGHRVEEFKSVFSSFGLVVTQ